MKKTLAEALRIESIAIGATSDAARAEVKDAWARALDPTPGEEPAPRITAKHGRARPIFVTGGDGEVIRTADSAALLEGLLRKEGVEAEVHAKRPRIGRCAWCRAPVAYAPSGDYKKSCAACTKKRKAERARQRKQTPEGRAKRAAARARYKKSLRKRRPDLKRADRKKRKKNAAARRRAAPPICRGCSCALGVHNESGFCWGCNPKTPKKKRG